MLEIFFYQKTVNSQFTIQATYTIVLKELGRVSELWNRIFGLQWVTN